MRHVGAILLAVSAACGGAAKKPSKAPHIPENEDVGPVESGARPLLLGDTFEAPYPGTPMPVRVTTLAVAISEDQRPVPGAKFATDGHKAIRAVGEYLDPDRIRHIALAYVFEGAKATSSDIMWFENTGGASTGGWRVWQERFGHGNLLALHGDDGAMKAVRFVEGIQRTYPIAFDGGAPLLLAERGAHGDDQPSAYEVFGLEPSGAIRSLVEVEGGGVALTVEPNGIVVRTVPELGAACTPNHMMGTGCAVAERTYAWKAGAFVRGPDVARLWKLVDTKAPTTLPADKPRKKPISIDFEDDIVTP
jgi:hypothetical protein